MNNRGDWLVDRVLHAVIGGAMRLPYEKRVAFMGAAMRWAVGPLAGYRKRAETNLATIYPDMGAKTRRRIADGVCDNFGRTLIENFSHAELHHRLVRTQPSGGGLEHVRAAAEAKRPVIFVTGHFGNHEAPRHVLTGMGLTVGGLYRPMANAYFDARYAKTMTSWGGPVFAQGRAGTIGFARHLKAGGMGTLLFDVNNDNGIPVDFLGRPAMTATSAADLAHKFDAVVIPYFAIRQADGISFDVVIEAPIARTDQATMMAEMNARLGHWVTQHPEQWFWVHRRWKNKRGTI